MIPDELSAWLKRRLAALARRPESSIAFDAPFADLGLDSPALVGLVGELEEHLGRTLQATLFYDHPSIREVVRALTTAPTPTAELDIASTETGRGSQDIAIVGLACRFPQVHGPEEFWRLLRDGKDAVAEIPPDRQELHAWSKHGPQGSRYAGLIEDIAYFDHQFFAISRLEANEMDPQQRLLLQVAWEAIEDAGLPAGSLRGTRTGVFLGISSGEYALVQAYRGKRVAAFTSTGNSPSIAANRLSYFYDFRGPSLVVDTACSSSLVALHYAVQSLRRGESSLALVGGASIMLSSPIAASLYSGGAGSPTGRCRPFSNRADGIVRAEGVAVAVLKPLAQARQDGDRIYACVSGSAINQSGRGAGLTAPSTTAQRIVVEAALRDAGVAAAAVEYVECHGTGTPLGDPIEAHALSAGLRRNASTPRCGIGSVKSNIGHAEAAAGMAGLIKVALALRHGELPPSLHADDPHDRIDFKALGLRPIVTRQPWRSPRRVAGVSAFGFGGTNAHAILRAEGAESATADQGPAGQAYIVSLSAHGSEALRQRTQRVHDALLESPEDGWLSVAYTLAVRREHLRCRMAVVGASRSEICAGLTRFVEGKRSPWLVSSADEPCAESPRQIAFAFSGHGGHSWQMGRELLECEPVFARTLGRCDAALRSMAGWSLLEQMTVDQQACRIGGRDLQITQAAVFSVQVALAELLQDWGVVPTAVVGHSQGEIAAACIAGMLSLEDGLRVVLERTSVMSEALASQHDPGSMLFVNARPAEIESELSALGGRVIISAYNSSSSLVLSGESDAIQAALQRLHARSIFCQLIDAPGAGHTPSLLPYAATLVSRLAGLKPSAARIPMFSSVTGEYRSELCCDAEYWSLNMTQPVRFEYAVKALLKHDDPAIVEIGPHPQLVPALKRCLQECARSGPVLSTLSNTKSEYRTLLKTAASLHCLGVELAWSRLWGARPTRHADLPPYPFQAVRCWFEDSTLDGAVSTSVDADPVELAVPGVRCWRRELSQQNTPYLTDHRIADVVVVPGTCLIDLARDAARQVTGEGNSVLADVEFERLISQRPGTTCIVQSVVSAQDDAFCFAVYASHHTKGDADLELASHWVRHARGRIERSARRSPAPLRLPDIAQRCNETLEPEAHYARMAEWGVQYGPSFRLIESIRRRDGEAVGRIRAPNPGAFDPTLLDACLQIGAAAIPREWLDGQGPKCTYLPVAIDRVELFGSPGQAVWSHALPSALDMGSAEHRVNVVVSDEAGVVLAELTGFRVRRVHRDDAGARSLAGRNGYRVHWRQSSLERAPALRHAREFVWRILPDRNGIGNALQARLQARGCAVQMVRDPVDIPASAAEAVVIDLRQLDLPRLQALDAPADLGLQLTAALSQVTDVARHLIALPKQSVARLWLVTRAAQPVGEESELAVLQAPAWGFGRALAVEQPQYWGGLIDLDPDSDADHAAAEIERIIVLGADGDQVALRGGHQFVPRLVIAHEPWARLPAPTTLRRRGTYLITGGLGGLGLALAQRLVRSGARCLVLTTMNRRIEQNGEVEGLTREQRAVLQRLRDTGAAIHIAGVDAGDARATAELIRRIGTSMPPLRGVFHLAGVATPTMLAELSGVEISAALHAKAQGAWNLHLATRAYPLDCFVLFSSASALWGSTALCHYAAANHFLDALANFRHRQGLAALSVNWGMWGSVGLASSADAQLWANAMGLRAMSPAAALASLELLLGTSEIQFTLADVDWSEFRPLFEVDPRRRLLTDIDPGLANHPLWSASNSMREALLALPRDAAAQRIETELREALVRALGVSEEDVDPQKPLDALGLDSLLALELKTRFESSLGVVIPVVKLLGDATIQNLASELVRALHDTGDATAVDLQAEAVLDPDIRPVRFGGRRHEGDYLLTGVTGFLGASLLVELLQRTRTPVHCLVRAPDVEQARARIETALRRFVPEPPEWSERIIPVVGDLAQERLGLEWMDYAVLRERVAAIVHSGAWLNPVYGYAELAPTNVGGTRELIAFASGPRPIALHHISSLAVFPWDRRSDGVRYAEAAAQLPQGLPDGYCQTKWVAERLVHQAHERGLTTSICRPGLIVGHSRTAVANDQDLFGRLIIGCAQLGSYPDLAGSLDLTPVDYAARAIAHIVTRDERPHLYYHIAGDRLLPWRTLFEWLGDNGLALERLPFDDWKQCLQRSSQGNALRYVLPLLDVREEAVAGERTFDASHTAEMLAGTDIQCPALTRELVCAYASYYLRASRGSS